MFCVVKSQRQHAYRLLHTFTFTCDVMSVIVKWLQEENEMKWNEWGFTPPLGTYRILNWARRTSWGWWDEWADTALQTEDSKLEPWRSEAEHATSRSQRLSTILNLLRVSGEETCCFFETWRPEWGSSPRSPTFQAGSFNHCTRAPPYKEKLSCSCRKNPRILSLLRWVYRLLYGVLVATMRTAEHKPGLCYAVLYSHQHRIT